MTDTNTPDLAAIADAPEAHGFQWTYGPLEKHDIQVVAAAPHVNVTDIVKFRDTFGDDRVKAWLNGTALRVETQRVNRDACYDNRSFARDDKGMKLLVLSTMFGVRSKRVTVVHERKYLADDDTEWNTKDECAAYNRMLHEANARIEAAPENQQA